MVGICHGLSPTEPEMPRKVKDSKDSDPTAQVEKFRQLARQLGTDDDEERFDERLAQIVHAPRKGDKSPK